MTMRVDTSFNFNKSEIPVLIDSTVELVNMLIRCKKVIRYEFTDHCTVWLIMLDLMVLKDWMSAFWPSDNERSILCVAYSVSPPPILENICINNKWFILKTLKSLNIWCTISMSLILTCLPCIISHCCFLINCVGAYTFHFPYSTFLCCYQILRHANSLNFLFYWGFSITAAVEL